MLRVKLLEPSLLEALNVGKKTQVTFPWPENFANKSNEIAIYYPDEGTDKILGIAKIKSLLKIKGGVIPTGSSYEDAETWAQAEGFGSFWEADRWFSKKYGDHWQESTWGIVQYKWEWINGKGVEL